MSWSGSNQAYWGRREGRVRVKDVYRRGVVVMFPIHLLVGQAFGNRHLPIGNEALADQKRLDWQEQANLSRAT